MIEKYRSKSVKFIMGTVAVLTATAGLINALTDLINLVLGEDED